MSIDPDLRILHLGKFYPPARGGMESVLETLCRGERRAVRTRALVINRGRQTTDEVLDGVPVTRVARLVTIGAVAVAPSLPLTLTRADADIVVLHEPNPMALLAYFVARPAAPLIVWYHSEVVRPSWRYAVFYRPLLEFALRRVARIVVASPPMRDVPALAAHRGKAVVIPYGLDVDRYEPTPDVRARAETLRERARGPVVLFVGRLVSYKGLDVLIEAAAGLAAEIAIVGDGPLRDALEAMVRQAGIGGHVHFAGDVTDEERLAWLHACDVLVLPSTTRQEAFGMVQLEAMLCGRPVVSTDVPTGVSWVNVHEETGLVVRAGDAVSLRAALDRLLADAPLRHTLGSAARARVLNLFTADRMCAAMLALYGEVNQRAAAEPSEPGPPDGRARRR